MTHSLPGVDADAIMRMKMAAPSELKVQFMRWKDGRFQRDEFVALRKHEEIDVPTENTFTILFEAADVVGSSVGVGWESDVRSSLRRTERRSATSRARIPCRVRR